MSKSHRVEAIFNSFYEKRVKDKNISLQSHVLSYLDNKTGLDQFTASLDVIAVEKLCDAYFIDVIRYKEYHISPDDHNPIPVDPLSREWAIALHNEETGKRLKFSKIAALTVKWLLKYKPIILSIDDGIDPESIDPRSRRVASFINEDFALIHSMRLINANISKVDEKTHADLIYHYKYRQFDERHFFLLYEMLQEKFA